MIKKYSHLSILTLAIFTLSACASIDGPHANLGELKTEVKSYVSSGQYDQDFADKISEAESYIISKSAHIKNPAIVLDIDETSLSNLPQLEANDFSFFLPGPCVDLVKGPCGLKEWQKMARAKAFAPTLDLYNLARAHKVKVFFITGRDEKIRTSTEKNLRVAGYKGWTRLVMRPAGMKTPSATDYKAPQRRLIEAKGYNIIANIGDQPSDLRGGYALKYFLLPNPFYRIP